MGQGRRRARPFARNAGIRHRRVLSRVAGLKVRLQHSRIGLRQWDLERRMPSALWAGRRCGNPAVFAPCDTVAERSELRELDLRWRVHGDCEGAGISALTRVGRLADYCRRSNWET